MMKTHAERQNVYRKQRRARALKDRHLFGDEEERQAKEFIETSRIPGAGVRIPDQWIKDKDRMGAIRERTALAENHYRAKDGTELTFCDLLARLSVEWVKVSKDDDRKIQDLVILLARKTGVVETP